MIFRVQKALDLDEYTLRRLRALNNDISRGDIRDDGRIPGSVFRDRIDEHRTGEEQFPEECWVVMAHDGLRLAGWCMVSAYHKVHDDLPLNVPTAAAGFYVHPDYRRRGLGRDLVWEAENVARKNGMSRLLVNPWNVRSSSFFRSCGFVEAAPYVPGWTFGISFKDLEPEKKVRVA